MRRRPSASAACSGRGLSAGPSSFRLVDLPVGAPHDPPVPSMKTAAHERPAVAMADRPTSNRYGPPLAPLEAAPGLKRCDDLQGEGRAARRERPHPHFGYAAVKRPLAHSATPRRAGAGSGSLESSEPPSALVLELHLRREVRSMTLGTTTSDQVPQKATEARQEAAHNQNLPLARIPPRPGFRGGPYWT